MSKKIYLAGPMSGIPYFNFPAFFKAAEELTEEGYEVFNPARHDIEVYGDFSQKCPNGTHEELEKALWPNKFPTYRDFLKGDLMFIFDEAEAIALLPGWENSKGARAEKALADALGLEVIYL